jgi:hypothetical protein
MPVSRLAVRNDGSLQYVERCKQGGGSMPFLVVRLPSRQAGPKGEQGLRPVQRLNLTLLIYAEHDGSIGRVHVPPHDIAHFGSKLQIGAELERLHPMRL